MDGATFRMSGLPQLQLSFVSQLGKVWISKLDLLWLGQQPGCNAGLVIFLQLLTGEGEQDSVGAQVPEVAGESGESFLSQQLVHLAELLQFLVETEIVDRRISSKVTGCRTSQHTRKTS